MKNRIAFSLLAAVLAGTTGWAQTSGDIIRQRQMKSKSSGDIMRMRQQKNTPVDSLGRPKKAAKSDVTYTDTSYYFAIGVGPAFATDSFFDTGYSLTLALGADFNEVPARMELEYILQDHDLEDQDGVQISGDATQHAFMGNLYYDFEHTAELKPYLFGGLGFAYADGKAKALGTSASASETSFAYQAGAGVAYEMTDALALDLKYRYLGAGDGIDGHHVTFGVRCNF